MEPLVHGELRRRRPPRSASSRYASGLDNLCVRLGRVAPFVLSSLQEYYTLEVVSIINAVVAGLLQNSSRKFRCGLLAGGVLNLRAIRAATVGPFDPASLRRSNTAMLNKRFFSCGACGKVAPH